MTRSLLRRQLWLSAVASLALACSGSGGAPKVPLADKVTTDSIARATAEAHALIGPEAKAALDSGNALFRRKDYVRALAEYRHASELAPQHSAPLFGIYMVAGATNNKPLADSALAGIRVRNGPLPPGEAGAPHSMSDSSLKVLRAQMKKGAKPV
jgi:hypothetical protein